MRIWTRLQYYAFVFEKILQQNMTEPNTPTLKLSQNAIGFRTLQLNGVSYSQAT